MDEWIKQGHWWWLLVVPVATGMFALGGSWLGARLGKHTEHEQWLRNEKKKEYVSAIDGWSAQVDTLGRLIRGEKQAIEIPTDLSFISPIMVLAPSGVRRKMRTLQKSINECLAAYDKSIALRNMQGASEAHDALVNQYNYFLRAVRNDLGVKN